MRIKIIFLLIFLLGLCFVTTQVFAKYYRYKDENGNIAFTDDLSKVPEDQREAVKSYESYKSKEVPAKRKIRKTKDEKQFPLNSFAEERSEIQKEQAKLVREKEQLFRQGKLINTPKGQERHNSKVRELNKRIEAFKRKIDRYNKKVSH